MDIEGANMLFQLINKCYENNQQLLQLIRHMVNGNSYRLKDKIKIGSDTSEPMHNLLHFLCFFILILTEHFGQEDTI